MLETVRHVSGWVCGQNPAHSWSPGGELLPLCQRCTGVYVGAFIAALFHLAWRPAPTTRWLWLNGAFLLLMVPFGFHWIPQNAELRCGSGIFFGFGLVGFLRLTLPGNLFRRRRGDEARTDIGDHSEPACVGCYQTFAASLLAALVLPPLLAENGNATAAGILVFACVAGALTLGALLLANLVYLLRWLARRISTTAA